MNGFHVSVLRDSEQRQQESVVHWCIKVSTRVEHRVWCPLEGAVESFPLAAVEIDTPFFSGSLLCCVIDDPVADLMLGNVEGVQPIAGLIVELVVSDSSKVSCVTETLLLQ